MGFPRPSETRTQPRQPTLGACLCRCPRSGCAQRLPLAFDSDAAAAPGCLPRMPLKGGSAAAPRRAARRGRARARRRARRGHALPAGALRGQHHGADGPDGRVEHHVPGLLLALHPAVHAGAVQARAAHPAGARRARAPPPAPVLRRDAPSRPGQGCQAHAELIVRARATIRLQGKPASTEPPRWL